MVRNLLTFVIVIIAGITIATWMASEKKNRTAMLFSLLVSLIGLCFVSAAGGVLMLLVLYQADQLVIAVGTAATLFPSAYAFRWLIMKLRQRLQS